MRVVLITGASSGLGEKFAKKYASNGYNLFLVARSEEKLKSIKENLEDKYGIKVVVLVKDLSKTNSAQEVYNFAKENNLIVDILLNNAGFGDFGDFVASDLERQTNMINLNVTSLVQLSGYFLKDMVDRNYGKLLNVASIAGFMPGPKMSIYYATKAFVLSFTEALAEELSEFNIKISALCPGPTATNFEKEANVNFSLLKMSSAESVVEYGYNKFMNSPRVVIVPGLNNQLMLAGMKLLPKCLVRKSVKIIQTKFRVK